MTRNTSEATSRPFDNELSEQVIAVIRDRVATRYYEQPQVIDRVARAIHRHGLGDDRFA